MATPLDQLVGLFNFSAGKIVKQLIFGGICLAIWWWYLNRGTNSKKVDVVLDQYINKKRIFDGIYSGQIKKKEKDDTNDRIHIRKLNKFWGEVPDPRFFSHTKGKNGRMLLKGVHDGQGFIHWVMPDDTTYVEREVSIDEIQKDSLGKIVYEEHSAKDEKGENIVIDKETGYTVLLQEDEKEYLLLDDKGKTMKKVSVNSKTDFIYKVEKKPKTIEKKKWIREPSPREVVLESDVKLYFMNKNQELRERFKEKDTNAWKKQAVTLGILAMVIIMVAYMTYKHQQNITLTVAGEMEEASAKYLEFFKKVTKQNPDKETPEDYGKKIDGGG